MSTTGNGYTPAWIVTIRYRCLRLPKTIWEMHCHGKRESWYLDSRTFLSPGEADRWLKRDAIKEIKGFSLVSYDRGDFGQIIKRPVRRGYYDSSSTPYEREMMGL